MASNQEQKENTFKIVFKKFEVGASPTAHLDSLTQQGGSGAYSVATNVDVTTPGILTQGPGLSTLTAGTEAGAITELVNHIMDIPTASDVAYCISATKLYKISSTAVTNAGIWPHAITNATGGSSTIEFQGNVYYFFNKASGGDIGKYDQATTFDDDWGSTVPTGAAALQSAPHPVAKKEDILVFGNGRYLGTYISSTNTLAPTKLDFGVGTEVADVWFDANQWWIAVNSGVTSGTNRTKAQIYLWDGAALTSQLADEVAVGLQKIGFGIAVGGMKFVASQDISGSYSIGYISGRSIKPLAYFTGGLPTFAQKTLYKNYIALVNGASISLAGSATPDFPYSIHQHADGGYSTVGAIAAPFGTVLVASTQSTSFKLAKFSGYDIACSWKSIVVPTATGRNVGHIDYVIVKTKHLPATPFVSIQLEYNQAQSNSGTAKTINTAGTRRHVLKGFTNPPQGIEDLRVVVDWTGGNGVDDSAIKEIEVIGHYKEL